MSLGLFSDHRIGLSFARYKDDETGEYGYNAIVTIIQNEELVLDLQTYIFGLDKKEVAKAAIESYFSLGKLCNLLIFYDESGENVEETMTMDYFLNSLEG